MAEQKGIPPELIKLVQDKIGSRMQQIMDQEVPNDDYTVAAMQTLVLNRLMLSLVMGEEEAAKTKAQLDHIVKTYTKIDEKGNGFVA